MGIAALRLDRLRSAKIPFPVPEGMTSGRTIRNDRVSGFGGAMLAKNAAKVGPRYPQVVVLVGATGDLSQRKLLPGLFRLCTSGFIPGCRIIGVSLDELSPQGFRELAREALGEFAPKLSDESSNAFAASLDYIPLSAGASALRAAVDNAERSF